MESKKRIKAMKGGSGKIHQPTDISQCLEAGTSGGGGTANRPHVIINHNPRTPDRPSKKAGQSGGSGHLMNDQTVYALDRTPHYVSDTQKSIDMPQRFTDTTSPNTETSETQQKSQGELFPTLTSSLPAFPAKRFLSQANDVDLTTLEGLYFLRSFEFYPTKDPDIFYSKMYEVYCLTKLEKLSTEFLGFSPRSATEWNGLYLIQRTPGFPKTGKECSLSDILETNVAEKYYLSDTAMKRLFKRGMGKIFQDASEHEAEADKTTLTDQQP